MPSPNDRGSHVGPGPEKLDLISLWQASQQKYCTKVQETDENWKTDSKTMMWS